MTLVHRGVQAGACEYKVMPTLCVFPGSLPTFRYWLLDSACAFSFTFNPPTTTYLPF
jgi:hypothetical protein